MYLEIVCPVCEEEEFIWDEEKQVFFCEHCGHEIPQEFNNYIK
jgi:ribosomal protein S27E